MSLSTNKMTNPLLERLVAEEQISPERVTELQQQGFYHPVMVIPAQAAPVGEAYEITLLQRYLPEDLSIIGLRNGGKSYLIRDYSQN